MRFNIIFVFLLFTFFSAFGQTTKSRAELEAEKKRNLERIEQTKKVLSQTQKDKKVSMSEAVTIQRQIRNQERKISLAQQELNLIRNEIIENQQAQDSLNYELEGLQKEYTDIIKREAKNSSKITKLSFLFSSKSLTELFLRYKYLKQYSESRKGKFEKIKGLTASLQKRKEELTKKRVEQSEVIGQVSIDKDELDKLKLKQDAIVSELSKKESQLKTELQKQQRALNQLNSTIAVAIANERAARKREEEARKAALAKAAAEKAEAAPTAAPEKAAVPVAPTRAEVASVATGKFSAARNRLAWPASGFVSSRFGVRNHAVLKGIKVDNHGIDIRTAPGAEVRAVFEGVVLDISEIPGLNNVVAVQHGDYYTVYANLASVAVRVNQRVSGNEIIGTAANKDGVPEINFQIWHNFTKLNPEQWLLPR